MCRISPDLIFLMLQRLRENPLLPLQFRSEDSCALQAHAGTSEVAF